MKHSTGSFIHVLSRPGLNRFQDNNKRRNFSSLSCALPLRKRTAIEITGIGEDGWKDLHSYGRRWNVKIFFSPLTKVA